MSEQKVNPVFDGHDNVFTITGPNGKDEAEEFLSTLAEKEQARFQRYLERLRDGQQVKSPENMRHIKQVKDPKGMGAEVHELKSHSGGGLRLFVVRYHSKWYLTHGGKKVSERRVPVEAARAFDIFWNE